MALSERFIRKFVATGADINSRLVIPGNDNSPTPNEDFITVLLVNDLGTGEVFGADTNNGDGRVEVAYRIAEFSIQFYGKTAYAKAQRFVVWAGSDDGKVAAIGGIKGDFPATSMRLDYPLNIQQIDGIYQDNWEKRFLVTMRCHYYIELTLPDRDLENRQFTIIAA